MGKRTLTASEKRCVEWLGNDSPFVWCMKGSYAASGNGFSFYTMGGALLHRSGGGGYCRQSSALASVLRFLPGLTDEQSAAIWQTGGAGLQSTVRAARAAGYDVALVSDGHVEAHLVYVWRIGTVPPMLWGTASQDLWTSKIGGDR